MSNVENNFKALDLKLVSKDIKDLNINNTSNNTSNNLQYVSEIRVGIIGSVDSGKSTLTGVLTKNVLDNQFDQQENMILKNH